MTDLSSDTLLLWGAFAILALFILGWQVYENRSLSRRLAEIIDDQAVQSVARFAWMRTLQTIIALIGCAVILGFMDEERSNSQHTADTMAAALEHNTNLPAKEMVEVAIPVPVSTPTPTPILPDTTPVAAPVVTPAPAATPTTQAPASIVQTPVEEVYNPERDAKDNDSRLDDIKKRYENILVTYMFLSKCQKAGPDDYGIIMNALTQEMAGKNPPPQFQENILSAAQGSYKEMYTQTSCTGESIETLRAQYNDYLKSLIAQFPVSAPTASATATATPAR